MEFEAGTNFDQRLHRDKLDSPGMIYSEAAAQRLKSSPRNLDWETAEQLDLGQKWLVEARRSRGNCRGVEQGQIWSCVDSRIMDKTLLGRSADLQRPGSHYTVRCYLQKSALHIFTSQHQPVDITLVMIRYEDKT